MGIRKSQMEAVHRYNTKNYYRPSINLRREYEDLLRAKAEQEGKTVSTYIQDLIKKDLGITETEN